MEEDFILPVTFNDDEIELPARLLAYGYSFKIEVDINDTKVQFERDEERNWRALISYEVNRYHQVGIESNAICFQCTFIPGKARMTYRH